MGAPGQPDVLTAMKATPYTTKCYSWLKDTEGMARCCFWWVGGGGGGVGEGGARKEDYSSLPASKADRMG